VHAAVSKPHTCLADLLDPVFERCLITTLCLVGVERTVNPQSLTSLPGCNLPDLTNLIDQLATAIRLQSFFDKTSRSMALSNERSATVFFS
tara:strand:+ start:24886 stop:25158 length:273 start_codon:yes stop_codon:yes gene_type:complete